MDKRYYDLEFRVYGCMKTSMLGYDIKLKYLCTSTCYLKMEHNNITE